MSVLNFAIPVICLAACIPMGVAWIRSNPRIGKATDPEFFQLIAGSVLQSLSLATLVYPTLFKASISHLPWLLTWILVGSSTICIFLSVLFYPLVSTCWSMVLAFSATLAQSLIVLQIVHAI
jgi:hypothetical protein